MASRSFKPASYLASAQSGRRPSFARTSSSSSTHSNKSDDSFLATLRSLKTSTSDQLQEKEKEEWFGSGGSNAGGGISPRCDAPSTSNLQSQQVFDDTPGRKRSDPISIELPPKNHRPVYTPLSARGDLLGGYFPNHETIQKQYNSHPFSIPQETPDPPTMSNTPSTVGSPSDSLPWGPASLASQPSLPVPKTTLMMPMGKYHPSNYKLASPTVSPAPTSVPAIPTSLEIPSTKRKQRPNHERRTSDVKRKIQQYQRDMIAQARLASASHQDAPLRAKPDSPKLLPLGSPGPITPFELEDNGGYMVAGARAGALGLEREREIVGRMIRQEERRIGVHDGSRSPVLI